MEKLYHKGGYLCCNCHRSLHKDISILEEIYDDKIILRKSLEDSEMTRKNFKKSLVYYKRTIKNPLKSEVIRYFTFVEYLMGLNGILKYKGELEGVTRKEIQNYLGFDTYNYAFEKKELFKKYVYITNERPVKYYITEEGKKIVSLLNYFRDYYSSKVIY